MRNGEYKEYFLDPPGKNLDKLIDSTLKALNALKIWWLGENPKISKQDLEKKRNELIKFIEKNEFKSGYQKIGDLLFYIMNNVKFNQKNFVNIHPSPFLPATLASFLVAIQNPNNISEEVSPATTVMERECIQFYADLIGYPPDSWGTIVCDGTIGNLTAMLIAREEKYGKNKTPQKILLGVEGLYSKKPGIFLSTTNVHYSIDKAMWILGLGTHNLIKVPVTIDERRFQEEHLSNENRFEEFSNLHPEYDMEIKGFYDGEQESFSLLSNKKDLDDYLTRYINNNFAIIGVLLTAGTTQTGTLENISELIKLKSKYNIYLHVDAAIGGYALCVPEIKKKLIGIERTDSISIDGHKLGFLHYPCGAVLFRKQKYRDLIEHTAPYLQQSSPTIEGSRPGTNAAACWLTHNILMEKGYKIIIEKLLKQTKFMATRLKEEEKYQIYHKIHLNTIVFGIQAPNMPRKKINQFNLKIAEYLNNNGKFFVSTTQSLSDIKVRNIPSERNSELVDIHGIRVLIVNPYTEEDTIEEFLTELNLQMNKIVQ